MYPHVRQFETMDNRRQQLVAGAAEHEAKAPAPRRRALFNRRRRAEVCTQGG